MKILRWAFLLFALTAAGQQPPFRVRLLSLFHLHTVTISADGAAAMRVSGTREAIRDPLMVRADGGSVTVGTQTVRRMTTEGRVRIGGGSIRAMSVSVPLEITAQRGELHLIALYPIEDYVAAVLQGETAGDMPPEALKALAVAIRSYATRFRERHQDEHFDFCDSTHCQYLRTEVSQAVQLAVAQTANELLWDRGSPLPAYYHKDCGGRTEDAAAVWPDQRSGALVVHDDPYCRRISASWRTELTRDEIAKALMGARLQVPAKWDRIVATAHTSSGRVSTLEFRVGESQQRAAVSASSVRFALGQALGWNTLKSDGYDVSGNGDRFVFSGRGVGHGVGLCQTGAAEMAKQGKNYREILAFYYPGAAMGVSAQGIPWITQSGAKVDVRAVNAEDINRVLPVAEDALAWATGRSGLTINARVTVDAFPSVEMYRNATGEPGWVAASTRGDHVRIQPPRVLGARLNSLLRHELLHALVEGNANPGTPLWFCEGLVLYLGGERRAQTSAMATDAIEQAISARADEASVERAYATASARVSALARQYGREELLRWLRSGVPSDAAVGANKVAK